ATADAELGRQRDHPAPLDHPAHLGGGAGHVVQPAEVFDRAVGEDPVEGLVGVVQLAAVHVLHDEAAAVPPGPRGDASAGVGQHAGGGLLVPDAGGDVQVGREDAPGVAGQVKGRDFAAGPDAQDLRVGTD